MALCKLGSFKGTVETNINLVNTFKINEKAKNNEFHSIKKIAIEAPVGTNLKIENVDIMMPTTGILEFGYDYILVNSIIFLDEVEVNIIYLYE